MSTPDSSGSRSFVPVGSRSPWWSRIASGLAADVRQTLRQFRKSKGIIAATLATLALCIGTTTAIFSMVYSLMLKPLPFDPAKLTGLSEKLLTSHYQNNYGGAVKRLNQV